MTTTNATNATYEAEAAETITEWAASNIAGSYSEPAEAALRLRDAHAVCRLIGGATVGPLPIGHEFQVIVIPIAPEETYPIRTKPEEEPRVGFGKPIVMTLANAVGVEWTAIERVRDGLHEPHCCTFAVHGRYRQNDGSWRGIMDRCDLDFRDGSPQLAGIEQHATMVQQKRANLERLAITGAKLRALRCAFGIQHGAALNDLDRPFVVCKVVFTGRDKDPAIQRILAGAFAAREAAAGELMYGLPRAAVAAPPPVALLTSDAHDLSASDSWESDAASYQPHTAEMDPADMEDEYPGEYPEPAAAYPPASPPPPPPAPSSARQRGYAAPPRRPTAAPVAPPTSAQKKPGPLTIPFGNNKGTPIGRATTADLVFWVGRKKKSIADGDKPQWRAADEAWIAAADAELQRRGVSR